MNLERAMSFLSSGTFDPNTLNYKWYEYYDSIELAVATTKHKFFAVPEGQGGKNRSRTNWQVANQMPESEKMAVMFLGFYYTQQEVRTQAEYQYILDVLKNSYFQFTVYNKAPMVVLPLTTCFGTSFALKVTGAIAGDAILAQNRVGQLYELPIELPLAAKTTITAEIIMDVAGNTALDGDRITLSMVGPVWTL